MTQMVTSGSMSGEKKRSDGLLGESGNERRRSFLRRRAQTPPRFSSTLPADFRDRHDSAVFRRHNRTRDRRVFVQRQMRTRPLMVRTIAGHQPVQTGFVENDHVIETLATSGSNKSLDEGILPRRPQGRGHFFRQAAARRS